MLWKFFYAGSQIRAVQIRAMRNRASRGMTVISIQLMTKVFVVFWFYNTLNMFYKERSDLVTSWGFSDFYSRSLKLFFRFSTFIVVL